MGGVTRDLGAISISTIDDNRKGTPKKGKKPKKEGRVFPAPAASSPVF